MVKLFTLSTLALASVALAIPLAQDTQAEDLEKRDGYGSSWEPPSFDEKFENEDLDDDFDLEDAWVIDPLRPIIADRIKNHISNQDFPIANRVKNRISKQDFGHLTADTQKLTNDTSEAKTENLKADPGASTLNKRQWGGRRGGWGGGGRGGWGRGGRGGWGRGGWGGGGWGRGGWGGGGWGRGGWGRGGWGRGGWGRGGWGGRGRW